MTLREMLALERDYRRVSTEHRALRVKHWQEAFAPVEEPLMKHTPGPLDPPMDSLSVKPAPSSKLMRFRGGVEMNCKDCGLPTGRDKQAVRCLPCAKKHKRATMRDRWRDKSRSPYTVDAAALRTAIIAKRKELGISQCRAAELAGVSHTFVRFVETGKQEPRRTTLRKLCAWLGVAPETSMRSGRGQAA